MSTREEADQGIGHVVHVWPGHAYAHQEQNGHEIGRTRRKKTTGLVARPALRVAPMADSRRRRTSLTEHEMSRPVAALEGYWGALSLGLSNLKSFDASNQGGSCGAMIRVSHSYDSQSHEPLALGSASTTSERKGNADDDQAQIGGMRDGSLKVA